jgi:glyoxylase-like metal-dependent hydrolase (beta-lactamase superfamily II)
MTNTKPVLNVAPAQLPLPGGRDGASVVLHPLLCAEMRGPIGWFERSEGRTAALRALGIGVQANDYISVPIIAFLVEHPSAGAILIDTGLHGSLIDGNRAARNRNLGPIGRLLVRDLRMRPEQTVVEQVRARGVDPATVGTIVMTHLHFDHASALSDFPTSTVLVSAPEWHAARERGSWSHGYSPAQLDPGPTYRMLDFALGGGASTAARPRDGFAQTLDVFGDGSLILVFTPGHSRGHMSVILRLSARTALIAGDASYTMATLRAGARPWRCEDTAAFERSLAALATYDREHPDALIVPGHDMEHWRTLDERYS